MTFNHFQVHVFTSAHMVTNFELITSCGAESTPILRVAQPLSIISIHVDDMMHSVGSMLLPSLHKIMHTN